jgi:hypothetical protein
MSASIYSMFAHKSSGENNVLCGLYKSWDILLPHFAWPVEISHEINFLSRFVWPVGKKNILR